MIPITDFCDTVPLSSLRYCFALWKSAAVVSFLRHPQILKKSKFNHLKPLAQFDDFIGLFLVVFFQVATLQ